MADDPWDELGIRGRSLALSTRRPPRFHPGLTAISPGLIVGMRQKTRFDSRASLANRGSRLHPGLGIQARAGRVVERMRAFVRMCSCAHVKPPEPELVPGSVGRHTRSSGASHRLDRGTIAVRPGLSRGGRRGADSFQ